MLSSYRVIDLTHERGLLCGQILADLGADVIQVEPPAGSAVRRLPPFYKDEPGVERSLHWWALARNKRGVTLDIEREAGRDLLRRLLATADLLIESEDPGALEAHGLGAAALAAANPRLVHVSITPFGSSGPKAAYLDTDLIMMSAGGAVALTGDEDRPPLRVSVAQAYAHASAEAAAAALIALRERHRSGLGQHVDVSVQQAVSIITLGANLGPLIGAPPVKRIASGVVAGRMRFRTIYPAADGWVLLLPGLTPAIGSFMTRLMTWLHEEGLCDEALRDTDWGSYGIELVVGQRKYEDWRPIDATIEAFTRARTKAELLAGAVERKLLIAPVMTIDEVADGAQAVARESLTVVGHPEVDAEVRMAGPFARFGRTPIRYQRRAPLLGEHNGEVFRDELALDAAQLAAGGVTP